MKKMMVVLILVLLLTLVMATSASAKKCPWRNKHCRVPTATVSMTVSPQSTETLPPIIVTRGVQTGTPVYVCQSLGCETPGRP